MIRSPKELSIIVPVYNESGNILALHKELVIVLSKLNIGYEIIFVDDGSTDDTFDKLKDLSPVTVVSLARNFGQTAAFAAGIHLAKGEWIVTIDGDGENDPADIPKLLARALEGYDIVSGWRKDRWSGQFLRRKLPSWLANKLISRTTGVVLHDHGCSLKIYRRSCLQGLKINGDLHRMLAAYIVSTEKVKISELAVNHRPRASGQSKYGLSRTFKVILDIITFHFFKKYGRKPMHFFGGTGLISLALSFVTFAWALYLKFFAETNLNRTPLPIFTAILILVGFQFILLGLLSELILRNLAPDQDLYKIKEVINKI